ncbi:MAG TPA: type 1 glutamine amidotransferase [Phycisphaerales bacterium]|nr:type 1 glutamine amidotransferase [Phycisphaerales bacterium]
MIYVLQHSDSGHAGRLGATLRDHGFKLHTVRPDKPSVGGGMLPPDLDGVEGLVILGGPQNVTDIEKHAWMQREVDLIKAAHAAELPVIGICLGAQLIAHALGGKVTPREKPAIGFYPMGLNAAGQVEPVLGGVPWTHQQLFSCGQEVSQVPAGAAVLSGTPQVKVQVFRAGFRTYGFLCHFECDRPMVDAMMTECRDAMERCGTTTSEVKVQADQQYERYARVSDRICVNLATLCFPLQRRVMVLH